MRVDASLNVVVGIGETLSVFATVDGVQQGAPILTFAGTGAAASAAGFGVVSVPDGVHTIGIQLVSSAPAAVLSGTLTAAGCLSGEVEQG